MAMCLSLSLSLLSYLSGTLVAYSTLGNQIAWIVVFRIKAGRTRKKTAVKKDPSFRSYSWSKSGEICTCMDIGLSKDV